MTKVYKACQKHDLKMKAVPVPSSLLDISRTFSLKFSPCFIENFDFPRILEYCNLLDVTLKVNNNYKHVIKKKKDEDLCASMFVM